MEKKKFVKIKTNRYSYGVEEVVKSDTLSVREFIQVLQDKCEDLDSPMAYWNDNGYTLGVVQEDDIEVGFYESEE